MVLSDQQYVWHGAKPPHSALGLGSLTRFSLKTMRASSLTLWSLPITTSACRRQVGGKKVTWSESDSQVCHGFCTYRVPWLCLTSKIGSPVAWWKLWVSWSMQQLQSLPRDNWVRRADVSLLPHWHLYYLDVRCSNTLCYSINCWN